MFFCIGKVFRKDLFDFTRKTCITVLQKCFIHSQVWVHIVILDIYSFETEATRLTQESNPTSVITECTHASQWAALRGYVSGYVRRINSHWEKRAQGAICNDKVLVQEDSYCGVSLYHFYDQWLCYLWCLRWHWMTSFGMGPGRRVVGRLNVQPVCSTSFFKSERMGYPNFVKAWIIFIVFLRYIFSKITCTPSKLGYTRKLYF